MIPAVDERFIPWIVGGLVVTGLFWIDPLFIPLALLGPLVTGVVAGVRGTPLRFPAAMWLVAGLGAVISDFVVNQEDVVFHLVLTAMMAGLVALAWFGGRLVGRRRVPA